MRPQLAAVHFDMAALHEKILETDDDWVVVCHSLDDRGILARNAIGEGIQ
jgi:hypothetical protein